MTGLDFGIWLRRRRLNLGWTLDAAAARVGCLSRSTLCRIEAGDHGPLKDLLALLAAYGVDVEGMGFVPNLRRELTENVTTAEKCGNRGVWKSRNS